MTFPLFEKVGGYDRALALISAAHGRKPSKFAVDKWRTLGVLPSKAAIPLIFECQRLGIETDEGDLRWPRKDAAA
jgi:hypothetical protein